MKYILAALCGLLALFMGGCAVVAFAAPPLPLLPGAIALLNVAMLAVIFNWRNLQWRWAFWVLGIADLIIAAVSLYAAVASGPADAPVFYLAGFGFLLKGLLSLVYVSRLPPPATPS